MKVAPIDPHHGADGGDEFRVCQIRLAQIHLLLSRECEMGVHARRALIYPRDSPGRSVDFFYFYFLFLVFVC